MDTFVLAVAAIFALAMILFVAAADVPNFPMHIEGFE